jgi:hypothetical protein
MKLVSTFGGHVLVVEEGDVVETSHYISKFKLAHQQGLLKERYHYLPSSESWIFGRIEDGVLGIHRHRENGNGYHDVAKYSLPHFIEVGTSYQMDPSNGNHSDTIVI